MKANFKILKMLVSDTETKTVASVSWQIDFYDDDNNYVGYEKGDMEVDPADPNNFIPYENLSPEDIENWIRPKLPVEGLYQAAVNRKIQDANKLKTNENILLPPWVRETRKKGNK